MCCTLWSAGVLAGERVYTGAGEDLYALFAEGEFRYGECHISLPEESGAIGRYLSVMRLEETTDHNGETYNRVLDSFSIEVDPEATEVRGLL